MFKPINKNLVVKVVKEEGGLVFVPDNFEVPNEDVVSFEIVASDSESAPKGMYAVYPFHRGIKYKKDNVDYVILRELDLCGVENGI